MGYWPSLKAIQEFCVVDLMMHLCRIVLQDYNVNIFRSTQETLQLQDPSLLLHTSRDEF